MPNDPSLDLARKLAPCPHCVMDVVGAGRVDTELGIIKCPMCNGTGTGADPEALEAIREFAVGVAVTALRELGDDAETDMEGANLPEFEFAEKLSGVCHKRANAYATGRRVPADIESAEAFLERFWKMAFGPEAGGVDLPGLIQSRDAAIRAETDQGCPCKHTTPCKPRCTCATPASSTGCIRCCRYGSPEQQKAMAERLARDVRAETIEAIRGALPCLHPAKCQRPNYLTCGNCRALDAIRAPAKEPSK